MNEISKFNLIDFLRNCSESSASAFENLKVLLEWLEDTKTQSQARIIFTQIENYILNENLADNIIEKYYFSIDKLSINSQENHSDYVTLLQLPSTFTPEDWSFTFFEGLLRCSQDEFYHRSVAELGCGNGWISIALAKKTNLYMIYGLDINPKAIVSAKINLYLNALNEKGQIKYDSKGKSLLDRVQFHVSDLLVYCIDNKIYLDKVIGCIPQVLSPNINIINNIIPENTSDEALYALSNYCSKQGYIEDQFGLGLVARATEESIQILKPNGKVILNMGGRPGQAVLNRLFTRRGFSTNIIWQTKIEQADDTDILTLVDIEKKSFYRFEFFMSAYSKESITARTAHAFSKAGGKIFHSLNVIEAHLNGSLKMRKILELLKNPDYSNARGALDLAYSDPSLVEEKISFLSSLTEKLMSLDCFPYEDVQGGKSFRRRIAEFFRTYWKVPISAKNMLIAPNRVEIIKNIISILGIKKSLIDLDLCKLLPPEILEENPVNLENDNAYIVIEAPKHCHSICELIEKLRPELVVCCLQHDEIQNQDSFLRLIEVTKKYQVKLIFDFSEHFNLTSIQKSNGLIEYLSGNYLPPHVSLMCGLIYNKIYADMDIAFLISENATLLKFLANAAELTYSRSTIITQEYYDTILFNLLNFHIKSDKRDKKLTIRLPLEEDINSTNLQISMQARNAFLDPALESADFTIDQDTVRLDYGENCLPCPVVLKSLLIESLSRQNISDNELFIEEQISHYLSQKYNGEFYKKNIILGNGISSLFSSIAKYCAKNDITLLFPTGTYGYFIAAAKFCGANLARIKTEEEFNFKYNILDLQNLFSKNLGKKYYLFLNAPIVNPMGQIYTRIEIQNIFALCAQYNVFIIMDTIFSGLEFNEQEAEKLGDIDFNNSAILGGISKEFSAAGLRFGYAHINNKKLFEFVKNDNLNFVSRPIRYTLAKFYSLINQGEESLKKHFLNQKNILKNRAHILSKILTENGWQPLTCEGGLFLVAKPSSLVGKKILLPNSHDTVEINANNVHEILFKATKLLINSSEWCGIPDYCRFVLSVSEKEFNMACEKVKEFYDLVK